MKTAMQELIEKLSMKSGDSLYALAFYHDNDEIIKEALEKEKLQIMNAHCSGWQKGKFNENNDWLGHYNQTYNQEETLEEWKSKFTYHCAIKTNQNK